MRGDAMRGAVAEAAAADPSDPVPATLTTLADPERFEAARSGRRARFAWSSPGRRRRPRRRRTRRASGETATRRAKKTLEVVSSAEAKTTKARAKALAATVAWAAAIAAGVSRRAY